MGKWKQVQGYASHIQSPLENLRRNLGTSSFILLLDATWVSVLGHDKAVLIAYDTNIGVVDYLIRNSESKGGYKTLLRRLEKIGYKPICVVSDGHMALEAVIKSRNLPHQRCVVHLLRDLEKLLGKKINQKLTGINKRIYLKFYDIWFTKKIEDIPAKLTQLRFKKKKWLMKWFKKTLPDAILHLSYEEKVPHTTNLLENINCQIKQRIKTMRGMKSKTSLSNFLKILFYFRKYK